MIRFQNIVKKYGDRIILDHINFEINKGEFVVLIGPSGCGKTTTLKMINRLIQPNGGEIFIDGRNIKTVDPVELRRTIGYVIQQIGLFPNMTVEQNISVVPKLLKYSKEKCHERVIELLEMVDMPYDEYAKKYPSELSGGQQQRIGVLRALAGSPPIVLMDEPFGALDPMTRTVLQDEVKKLQKKLNKTIVFITHDMDEALRMADVIVFMNEGKIVQMAPPEELLRNPSSDIIKRFMGKRVNGDAQRAMTAAEFMRTNIFTVEKTKKILECTEMMSRRNVNTLIVLNEDDTYAGSVSIDEIKNRGKAGMQVGEILNGKVDTTFENDDAKAAFEKLINSHESYVVVLKEDGRVAGIITKTGMAKALADALWGDLS